MLKIIMGSQFEDRYLKGKDYIGSIKYYFNDFKKRKWFKDKFVQEIIREIDKAEMDGVYSVISLIEDTGYSVNDLAGGTKTLILIYELRDKIFYANLGDNCTDFLERITLEYEKEGKDLLIVSNYLNNFQFNYIDKIYYVNWDITCTSNHQLNTDIFELWYNQEHPPKTQEEIEQEALEEELEEERIAEEMDAYFRKLGVIK